MKTGKFLWLIVVPLFLPYTLFLGCSAVGALVGASSSPARDAVMYPHYDLEKIPAGTDAKVVKFDCTVEEGTFTCTANYIPKLYARDYDSAVSRIPSAEHTPKFNQRILIAVNGTRGEGYFRGIDRGTILVQVDTLVDPGYAFHTAPGGR